jgi:hypothetical protein
VTQELDRRRHSLLRRSGSKIVEVLGEFVGEALLAAAACVAAGVAIAGAVWGWNRHPIATIIAAAVMVLLLGYGAWDLRSEGQRVRERGQRRRLAVAIGAILVTAVWLLYVVDLLRLRLSSLLAKQQGGRGKTPLTNALSCRRQWSPNLCCAACRVMSSAAPMTVQESPA